MLTAVVQVITGLLERERPSELSLRNRRWFFTFFGRVKASEKWTETEKTRAKKGGAFPCRACLMLYACSAG